MKYSQAEQRFTHFKTLLRTKLKLPAPKAMEKDTHKQEGFAKLSKDDKLQLISPQLELYVSAVQRKTEVLPIIATVAATLIVIATLNSNLVPLTTIETKCILSLLLSLIPITLNYYIKVMEKTARNAMDAVRSYHSVDPFEKFEHPSFLQQLSSDFPMIIVYLFYGVVLLVMLRVWFG